MGDALTHDDEITVLAFFKKLLTHSISLNIIAGGLILIYDFFALKTEKVVQYHPATSPLSPMRRGSGHWSWVMWAMGHEI